MLITDESADAIGHSTGLTELRTEFIRVAAHELRTPLTSIITFANMLDAPSDVLVLEPADRHSALAAIRRNAERMQLTVADLMLLAQLETAEEPLDAARVAVAPLLAEITAGMAVTLRVPQQEIFADEPLLRQLLRTAVDVARIADDSDAPVAVESSRDGNTWILQVHARVSGPLSSERLLSMRIPHPDHPGEHRTAALALMLGREIAARHGGEMITTVQRGVTVRITLPIA